ncbi:undecaprenyl-diphosphatase [Amycolatopsis sulphurea]|uniref:Undecaprenyl-diphosphatase n=1 Tax=Amycolatopsis sulphurea TaxID=76022 RepID=A0A2A9FJT8_9PSEU|nr:phosphatase PAP2 family protein [Amycolatopsis sulphurea]PFG51011.1 undecaprenyl-diphosphatase [Amycolatopsis sulphurea]
MLFDVVNGLAGHNAALDAVMKFVAGPLIYVLAVAGALVVLAAMRGRTRGKNLWLAGQAGATLALGFLVNRVLRAFAVHGRPFESRPVHQLVEHEAGVSFPSNHATAALTIAFVAGFFVSRRWGWTLGVPAALIAISRVYVGVHWPSDIICGALVGLLATLVVRWAAPRVRKWGEARFAKAGPPPTEDTVDDTVVIPRVRVRRSEAETEVFERVR